MWVLQHPQHLLDFDEGLSYGLGEGVSKMSLEYVNGVPRHVGVEKVGVVKVSPVGDGIL